MRILFLTQWFQPESVIKGLPFAKALMEKGHEVEILTGFPNYPGGKIYPGYRVRLYQQEVMDGIKVHRVPLYPSHDKSALRRIINYLSFSISTFFLGPWLVKKPDVIYVYNLVTLGPPAFLLRLLYGSRVVLDVQDLWPESVAGSGMLSNKTILGIMNYVCNRIYRKADRLVVLSPGFKDHLSRRGISPDKIDVIYNWSFEAPDRMDPFLSGSREGDRKFTFLYAGNMGTVQGLDTVLNCAEICKTRLPDVEFLFIGSGVDRPRLECLASEMNLENVKFLPYRPKNTMNEVYAVVDALIVHLKDQPLFRITIPSKTQAYLYMGKPIIMALRGDASALVQASGAGIVCEPESPQAMADAVASLYSLNPDQLRAMGEAGRRYYKTNLALDKGAAHFEQIMLALVAKKER